MIELNAIMNVEMALISGVMPMRTSDQISSGSVLTFWPMTKNVVTKSSNDSVNDSSDGAPGCRGRSPAA